MSCFERTIFYQYSPKTKIFLKKNAKFLSNLYSEFRAARLPHFALFIITWVFVAFLLNNFFFIVQLQTL